MYKKRNLSMRISLVNVNKSTQFPADLCTFTGKILNVRRTILCNETIFCFREAARECRRKKKEYVKCLENRVAVLENQNKALIEELKSLKDLYCSKGD